MKKVFISYQHHREQWEKNILSKMLQNYGYSYGLKDVSVDSGDIDVDLPSETIYKLIREEYLRDSDVTIVILGTHTKCRKHVDREIGSSLRSYGNYNTKNGLLILLTNDFINSFNSNVTLNNRWNPFFDHKQLITQINSGQRLYDNAKNGYATVRPFEEVNGKINRLKELVDIAYSNSKKINPDNSAPFRTNNTENCPKKYY